MALDPAMFDSFDIDLVNLDPFPGGWHTKKRTGVRAGHNYSRDHSVRRSDQVFDFIMQVGKGCANGFDDRLQSLGALWWIGYRGCVVDVIFAEQGVQYRNISLVPGFVEISKDQLFVALIGSTSRI